MEYLTDIDEFQAALKMVNVNEDMNVTKSNNVLLEGVELDCYHKCQKILDTPEMKKCHKRCLDVNFDELNESDIDTINKLYDLGIERGLINPDVETKPEDNPEDKMYDKTHRFTGALSGNYKLTDWWDVTARFGYDNYTTDAYTYIAPGSVVSELYQNGRLSKSDYRYEYWSSNVMTNLHKTFGDFDLGLMLGTTAESTERLNQTHWGYNFTTPGTISFTNIAAGDQFFNDGTTKKRLVGVYGEARASYKNLAYLTFTGRNDWSSTLPLDNRSYFYSSVSGALVFTELLPKNDILSFGKVRASWAQVGKDADAYATLTYLEKPINYGGYTGVGNVYTKGNSILKPEIQTA